MPSCRRARLEQRDRDKDAVASRIHLLLPQFIRAITCRCCVNWSFYKSEEIFYILRLLGADDVLRSGCRTDAGVSIH